MNTSEQQQYLKLTTQRINRLPAEVVKIMLAGAKEEVVSINDNARFVEKKTFALMAAMLSITGFSGRFVHTLYEQSIFGLCVIGILALITVCFTVISARTETYYGPFFDIHGALELLKSDEKGGIKQEHIQDQVSFSRLLLLWYAGSIFHNAKVVNVKSAYFNAALISLIITIIFAVIMFIVIDINTTNPQNETP